MNLALFVLSIISFVIIQFKKKTGLPVSTVSCMIWLSILTMAFSDFTLFDVGSWSKSLFAFFPLNFFAFVYSIAHVFRDSFVLRPVCLYSHYFKITTWAETFSYKVTFLFRFFGLFRDSAHLLRSTHFCKVVGFSAIITSFAQCRTAF